jgi:hypothetical protein
MADDIFLGERVGAAHDALDRALRAEPGRILSVLARALGDIDLAEDALRTRPPPRRGPGTRPDTCVAVPSDHPPRG